MITLLSIMLINGLLAALILLFSPERKADRQKNNKSFTRSYIDAVKKEFGPRNEL